MKKSLITKREVCLGLLGILVTFVTRMITVPFFQGRSFQKSPFSCLLSDRWISISTLSSRAVTIQACPLVKAVKARKTRFGSCEYLLGMLEFEKLISLHWYFQHNAIAQMPLRLPYSNGTAYAETNTNTSSS